MSFVYTVVRHYIKKTQNWMKTHIEILIDNSNSMGRCEGLENHEQYLLPDDSTRMKLSKKILIN